MSNASPVNAQPQAPLGEHQRDLLLRLYREIGISAVAAALQIGERAPLGNRAPLKPQDNPRRGVNLAA